MTRYVVTRIATAILTTLGVATIVFVAMRLVPGGFAQTILGPTASQNQATVAAIEAKYGLNDPPLVQYGLWLRNAVQGDLGTSFRTQTSVTDEIVRRCRVTIELTVFATLLSLIVGIPLGVYAGLRRNGPGDIGTRLVALVGLSVPDFVLGTLLIYVVSTRGIGLPISAYASPGDDLAQHFKAMVLPTLSLGLAATAVVIRVIRSGVVEVLGEPFVTTARAKGLAPRIVALRHVVRAALIPTVTIVGINMGYLLGGAVLIEELFGLPGLGRYALQGILSRDYPVAQGTVIVGALLFVVANLMADLAYAYLDPRIKY
ncbi:MAG: Oligopeptide transport system permease protein OppB [uncultured Thermomicrobiales bacterium]|uniref:Oligopeptide transport system permease protein OppB n=1 Tax=uncultured Thermomicrobiales bacterium TaxID=1645740 RepID=A0A6J4UCU4_9BACT|nr:MAG: Oligopeptide transport system permease protein OppB [uncultured Thermomicrobiales bacterium]